MDDVTSEDFISAVPEESYTSLSSSYSGFTTINRIPHSMIRKQDTRCPGPCREAIHRRRHICSDVQAYLLRGLPHEEVRRLSLSYYEGTGPLREPQNPKSRNVILAYTHLPPDSQVRAYMIDQFSRSFLFRQAYTREDLLKMIIQHPALATQVMQAVQCLSQYYHKLSPRCASQHWRDGGRRQR